MSTKYIMSSKEKARGGTPPKVKKGKNSPIITYPEMKRGKFEYALNTIYKDVMRRFYREEGVSLTLYYVCSDTQAHPLHIGTWQSSGAWVNREEADRVQRMEFARKQLFFLWLRPTVAVRSDDTDLCACCSGSGEGMYDGSICAVCKGEGVEQIDED